MPDLLNKQAIVNLLIDSPLREPIKINLIDIVNNTNESDLPKVYSTITKELEIFQKATERRMKLASEVIEKLGGASQPETATQAAPANVVAAPVEVPAPPAPAIEPVVETPTTPLAAASLDLPPVAQMPTLQPSETPVAAPVVPPMPVFQPLGGAPVSSTSDEDALAEIQKELDSLKTEAAADVAAAAAPVSTTPPVQK